MVKSPLFSIFAPLKYLFEKMEIYFIIIKGGQIRINNNWYTFNREVLDVFLEVIKNSVVE